MAVSIAAVSHALLVLTIRLRTAHLGLLAGASAAIAVLLKQSFVDAFVFVGVLLLVGSWTRAIRQRYRTSRMVVTLGTFAAGAARSRC